MFEGHAIFTTPHMQIMAINFAEGVESCLIAEHLALCNGFVLIHFSL
jgi:hypothetical protein